MRYRSLLGVVPFALACQLPTASRQVERLTFESINAPAVVLAPGPIFLEIRVLHGACHHNVRIITTRRPGVMQPEALADYRLPPGAGGCLDIGVLKDSTRRLVVSAEWMRGARPRRTSRIFIVGTSLNDASCRENTGLVAVTVSLPYH